MRKAAYSWVHKVLVHQIWEQLLFVIKCVRITEPEDEIFLLFIEKMTAQLFSQEMNWEVKDWRVGYLGMRDCENLICTCVSDTQAFRLFPQIHYWSLWVILNLGIQIHVFRPQIQTISQWESAFRIVQIKIGQNLRGNLALNRAVGYFVDRNVKTLI